MNGGGVSQAKNVGVVLDNDAHLVNQIRPQFLGLHCLGSELSAKLKKVIGGMVEAAVTEQGWHTGVLVRELLSPSSHFQVLQQNEVFPKFRLILAILSEITSIPPDDPALFRCVVSVAAPCTMFLVVGRNLPAIAETVSCTHHDVLAAHLYHFAIGGLKAIRQEYKKHGGSH